MRGDWGTASRSDLLLFRKAIKENWPVPLERRGPLMAAALAPIFREDAPARLKIAAAWLAIAADLHDLELLERALQAERMAGDQAAEAPTTDGAPTPPPPSC